MFLSTFRAVFVLLVASNLGRADNLRVKNNNIFASHDNTTAALFRILTVGTLLQDERNSTNFSQNEEIACVLIIDGKEDDDLRGINLPNEFSAMHRIKILAGKLFVTISRTSISQDFVQILDGSQIRVVNNPRISTRAAKPPAIGKMTVAVLRISTRDSTPSVSAQELRYGLFNGNEANLKTQFHACSFGQLDWQLKDDRVFEVFVDEPVKNFKSGSSLIAAAQKVMKTTLHVEDYSKFADKTLMCLPPGTGNWVASSGVGHWRAQFNDGWCLSLSATIHELGHTVITKFIKMSHTLTSFP
jgi:hypothetical protein